MQRIELPFLETKMFGKQSFYFEHLASTNDYAKESESLSHGAVVLAGEQSGGRGRLGRFWSPVKTGEGLAMTLVLKNIRLERLAALPLCCGLGVARALHTLTGGHFGLKWPNDIICGGRKVCGILCETISDTQQNTAVCGIGINLTQDRRYFAERELSFGASILMQTGVSLESFRVAAAILNELEPLWLLFSAQGFPAILRDYSELCLSVGQRIRAEYRHEDREGYVLGIDVSGGLTVDFGGERAVIHSAAFSETSALG